MARIVRDRAGRPVTAFSPSGAETRFGYDAVGVLVRRVDPDGAVWAFEHDTAGRTTAVVAPDGGRTVFEYAPNGELVRTTDPLGRSIERVVDELGNLTGAVLPDGASGASPTTTSPGSSVSRTLPGMTGCGSTTRSVP